LEKPLSPITRKFLGDLLLEAGVITKDQLREALERQRSVGGRILGILVELGYVSETKLKEFFEKQLEIPTLNPLASEIETVKLIPAETAYKLKVIPIRLEKKLGGKVLIVATSDPTNIEIVDTVSFVTGIPVQLGFAPEAAIGKALKHYYGTETDVPTNERTNEISEEKDFNTLLEECKKAQKGFIDSLIGLMEESKRSMRDFKLPSWSATYILPQELEHRSDIQKLEQELNNIISEISKQKDSIPKLEQHKILFTGLGKILEDQVRKILEELGFTFTDGLPGRDSLALKYNGKVAVVEVKGVSESASEKHAVQLEKSVIEYFSSHEIMPKGILVINSYKDTPLKDRNGASFPDQVINYSEKRDHCLITGLQLLGLYLDCKDNPEKKTEVIDRIFSTNGVFSDYQGWRGFLIDVNEKVEMFN
jgi:type II secretion system (T2SS) protein E